MERERERGSEIKRESGRERSFLERERGTQREGEREKKRVVFGERGR
jgi:hypothetical protein